MNKAHLEICASPERARLVQDELLPWVLDGHELGEDLLEVGPGPGLTTDVLRHKAARITAVELDLTLAELARVLIPGGLLVGSDGLDTPARRELHEGDIFVPVDPGTLAARLRASGFIHADVALAGDRLRFLATTATRHG